MPVVFLAWRPFAGAERSSPPIAAALALARVVRVDPLFSSFSLVATRCLAAARPWGREHVRQCASTVTIGCRGADMVTSLLH